MKIKQKQKPVGLVLEGGGAKGAYQIGAWKALREMGISIDAVTGTSVGALNGALIAQGDFQLAYDLWYNMKPSMVVQGDPEVLDRLFKHEIKVEDFQVIAKYLSRVIGRGGLDISPLRRLVETYIDEEKIRQSSIRLGIVTVSLTGFKPIEVFIEDIPKGKLHDYLIASANLPVFKLERIDDKLYIDGGFYDILPVRLMASSGQKEIVSIELKALGIRKKVNDESVHLKHIVPSDDIGGLLEFNSAKTRMNLELGYFDALKVFRELKGVHYYIDKAINDDDALQLWGRVSDDTVNKLAAYLGFLSDASKKRLLFEKIIPRIVEILDLEPDHDYADILIGLYEYLAEKKNIERFRVYTYKHFRHEIESSCLVLESTGNKLSDVQLPRLLKQSNILLKALNEDIVERIIQHLIYDFYYR